MRQSIFLHPEQMIVTASKSPQNACLHLKSGEASIFLFGPTAAFEEFSVIANKFGEAFAKPAPEPVDEETLKAAEDLEF